MEKLLPFLMAIVGGSLLAVMIAINGEMKSFISPLEASWVVHGVGALVALLLLVLFKAKPVNTANSVDLAWWNYLGGLSGSFVVVLAVITVNSFLGITGTLVLTVVGQVLFGLISDQFGWFGLERHPFSLKKLYSICFILAGAGLIVYAKGALV